MGNFWATRVNAESPPPLNSPNDVFETLKMPIEEVCKHSSNELRKLGKWKRRKGRFLRFFQFWKRGEKFRVFPSNSYKGNIQSANERGGLMIESINGDLSSEPSIVSGDLSLKPSINNCSLPAFSFNELRAATRNFWLHSLVGLGNFGLVFKGWIDEETLQATAPGTGRAIAVKKLDQESLQGHKEWLEHVYFWGQLRHPHLVKLFGYCAEDDQRLLVYEFMGCGSLENHLFERWGGRVLSWAMRMRICVGAARGLAFLHEVERPVIYRDLNSSNILLDADYNTKLSDLGLGKDGPAGDKTHGCAAHEYEATRLLTIKKNVYDFGMVLLEILTGRRRLDEQRPCTEQRLAEWAKPYLADKQCVCRIIDYSLRGKYSVNGAQQVADLAHRCLDTDPKSRPLMKHVVKVLEPLQDTEAVAIVSNL